MAPTAEMSTPTLPPAGVSAAAWQEALDHLATRLLAAFPSATERLKDARALVERGHVRYQGDLGAADYRVRSQSDVSGQTVYTVHASQPQSCTCTDFSRHQQTCKHVMAVTLYRRALEYCEAHCAVSQAAAPLHEPSGPPVPQGRRSIREIIADLSRPLPKACIATKTLQGSRIDYIHWQTAVRLLDTYAPGWSGQVVRLEHVAEHCVIVYRITIPCAEGEVWREATGCEEEDLKGYGDMFSNAEAMAFKRAAAKFGVGLELYDRKKGA
jgi:hypothetical protein